MATKPTLELELYIHGQESTVGVLDGDGVAMATLAALQARKDLHFTSDGVEYFIPFHAVVMAQIERSAKSVEPVVDDLCVPVE